MKLNITICFRDGSLITHSVPGYEYYTDKASVFSIHIRETKTDIFYPLDTIKSVTITEERN